MIQNLTHQWRYKFNKPQWPYHGLSDRVFFSKTFYTWTSMTIPRSHRPGFFKPGLWDHGMVTGGPGQKPDWKNMTRSVRQWYGHWRVNMNNDIIACTFPQLGNTPQSQFTKIFEENFEKMWKKFVQKVKF